MEKVFVSESKDGTFPFMFGESAYSEDKNKNKLF